jgi:TonB family protein
LHVRVGQLLIGEEILVSQRLVAALLAVLTLAAGLRSNGMAQQAGAQPSAPPQAQSDEMVRRAKTKVQPAYPDLARKMNITGTVKVEVVVAPNGTVKNARLVGGHPVLAAAALDAAKKWRFDPAAGESTGVIDFKFEPR